MSGSKSRIYPFELLHDGEVVGGGWVCAPSPEAAAMTASILMAGAREVRLAQPVQPARPAQAAA